MLKPLREFIADNPCEGSYWLAYSGGLDSAVLLDLLTTLTVPLRVVHVNHGLHDDAAAWAEHCQTICKQYGLPLEIITLTSKPEAGESIEAWARNVRYQAIFAKMAVDDVLFTGHHLDDNVETFLLRLSRGAGAQGLSAMRPTSQWHSHRLLRPLLDYSKADLTAYAQSKALSYIHDPSNDALHFDRNFIRQEVLPLFKSRWPGFLQVMARNIEQLQDTQDYLFTVAEQLLSQCLETETQALIVDEVLKLSAYEQTLVLRQWFSIASLPMPSHKRLEELLRQLQTVHEESQLSVAIADHTCRVYQGLLYLVPPLEAIPGDWVSHWDSQHPLVLPGALGKLRYHGQEARQYSVRFRQGSERIYCEAHAHSKSLKNWLQEQRVPPWLRDRLPLIYADDKLIAVAWQHPDFSLEK